MISLQSSNLRAVDYELFSGTLVIAFHSGGVYAYDDVPWSAYSGLMAASSHGKYFHAHIKPYYACRRIR